MSYENRSRTTCSRFLQSFALPNENCSTPASMKKHINTSATRWFDLSFASNKRFARQYRYEPPIEIPLPFSRCVHHLSGPHTCALTQTTFKITENTHTCYHEPSRTQQHFFQKKNFYLTVLCVHVQCCVRAVCLASCENRPQHTAHEPQTHQKFESLKIINSRDDKIRFEFDELNAKRAEIVRIGFRGHSMWPFSWALPVRVRATCQWGYRPCCAVSTTAHQATSRRQGVKQTHTLQSTRENPSPRGKGAK